MFKFNIALFIMITFLYGLPHPPNTTLQWNQNIFGNWTKVKKVHPHKYKIKSNKPIHCRLINQKQRRSFSPENRMTSKINQLYSLNEMRINGIITKREYKRAKGNTMKKWNRCSIRKSDQIGNVLQLLTTIHETEGLNDHEYNRLKISLLR